MRLYQRFLPYGVAFSSTVIALLFSLWLEVFLSRTIGAFFYIAIILSTGYGGFRAGIVAVVLSTLAIDYFFFSPPHQIGIDQLDELLRLAVFIIVALTITLVTSNLKESQQKIARLNQQLIQENTEQLRMALSAAQMGMWDWNLVTGEVKWSPETEQLFGLAYGTFDGKHETFEACVYPDDRQELNQLTQKALLAKSVYQFEFRVIWPDGSIHWVESRGRGFYDQTGQGVRMAGTVINIDERKQSETLLNQEFEQKRLVMEMSQRIRQSLHLKDLLQTTVEEVRQYLQCDRVIIFQFAPDWSGTVVVESVGAEGRSILSTQIYDPCFHEKYIEPYRQGLITQKTDIYTAGLEECYLELLQNFQVRANLVVPILQSKNLWGLLIAHHCKAPREWQTSEIELLRQLSAQVSIAIQQADLFEQVQTESLHIQILFNTSFDGIVILDKQGNVLDANPRFSRMLGYTAEETSSLNVFDWDAHFTSEELQQLLNDHSPFETGIFETRHRRKDGSIYDVEVSISIVEWQGEILRFGVCREITERKQAEIALQNLKTELEQRVTERTAELTEVNNRLQAELLQREILQRELFQREQLLDGFFNAASSANIGLSIHDQDLHYLKLNQALADINGWSIAEHLGKTCQQITPEIATTLAPVLENVMNTGISICNLEVSGITLSQLGFLRYWLVSFFPIWGEVQQVIALGEIVVEITDRKRAEELLQQSELTLRSFFNSAAIPMGIVELHDGDILHISDNWASAQFFGHTTAAMENQFASALGIPPATIERWISYYQEAQRTQFPVRFEYLHITNDRECWLSGSVGPITISPSGYPRFSYIVEDITERKQAEATLLQKSRQEKLLWRITQAIRQSLDLNAILNTTVTEVRQTLQTDRAAIYRFNSDWSGDFVVESVAEGWVKLVGQDIQKVWEDTYLQETQGGRFRNNESFVINDIYQAELQPCHIKLLEQFQAKSYTIFPIFSGETLWGLLAIYQNTTSRHWQSWEVELLEQIASQLSIAIQQSELYTQLQIELQERKQAEATILEAERRWRSLLDNVQLIVVGLDQSGTVNYINSFFLKITGYTYSEVIGKNWFKDFLPFSIQTKIKTDFLEIVTHNNNYYPYYQNAILTQSGEERFIAWNNTILQDSQGNSIGTISIGEDITERQRIEQIKDEFIGIVSHELRTPLTAIQMSLGLIKTGVYDQKPEKSRRMIEIALLDTNRLVNLVNDILDLERLESGRAVLEKTVCQASDLIQQAIEGIQMIATQQQITLTFSPTDAKVWGAADAIIQTLTNLLSNAIKFSPPQSTIHLGAERQTDFVRFQVRDQGRGIPADKLELIFGRFQQVDASDSREKGGTGLGLAICQSIIERHGGKIWAESRLGAGSTFFFTLPLPSESNL